MIVILIFLYVVLYVFLVLSNLVMYRRKCFFCSFKSLEEDLKSYVIKTREPKEQNGCMCVLLLNVS